MTAVPTKTQRAVIQWLIDWHGKVWISETWAGVHITPWWRSEYARRHMQSVMGMLNTGSATRVTGKTERELRSDVLCSKNRAGGTPPLSKPTFKVLRRNGWLQRVGIKRWIVSDEGRTAVARLTKGGGA